MSFTEKISPDALKYFNEVCARPNSKHGVEFVNSNWS